MYLSGWLAAFVSILVLGLAGSGPAVAVLVVGWTSLSETVRRKLLWDNAARCYRRYGTRAAASPGDRSAAASASTVPAPA